MMEDKMEAHWTEKAIAEEWLKGPEEKFPQTPEAAILDEHGTVGPEINPQRRDAPHDPREGTDDNK